MKRIKLLSSLLVLFMAIGFVACDTEPVDPNLLPDPDNNAPASFEVDFSGSTYQATTTTAVVTNNVITITATRSSGGVFTLTVPAARGTYSTPVITYTPSLTTQGSYTNMNTSGVSGTVSIASINTTTRKVTGTFNFTGYWSDTTANLPNVEFTNGVFRNIEYTGDGVNPPAGDASFKVNFSGSTYTATSYEATVGVGLISVSGYRGTNGEVVGFTLDATSEGTYTGESVVLGYYADEDDEDGYTNFLNSSGTVTISRIDRTNHTISGTFSFTGTNGANQSIEFTNGEFTNIPYTEGNTSDEILTATVNGANVDYANSLYSGLANTSINFSGVGEDYQIHFVVDEAITAGNYPLSAGSDNPVYVTYSPDGDDDVTYRATAGTFNVTSNTDGWIKGTFNFTITNAEGAVVKTFTNGKFEINYDF